MAIFALVDCNNFYASCERVFYPSIRDKPVVVLSNNDGCVIARSNEAKQLNIPMGAPYFKNKEFFLKNGVRVFSSNYELYGDLSARVMSVLELMCPEIEIYSIDEAFLRLDQFSHLDLKTYCLKIKATVFRWLGIPISIGIGPTKTLAKIANKIAKKKIQCGVLELRDPEQIDEILRTFSLEDIWGINIRLATRLQRMGITTALELKNSDPKLMRKAFSVVMERMVYELNGIVCLDLEEIQPRKQIMSSRSFGTSINTINELGEAAAYHVSKVCEKLRKQNSRASGIYFFLHTNPFSTNKKQYSNSISFSFPEHTDNTSFVLKCAINCLKWLYRPGYDYHKLGVMLLNLVEKDIYQQDLFLTRSPNNRSEKLMTMLDTINSKIGKGSLKYCREISKNNWALRAAFKSNNFTTCKWELLRVYCR